MSSTERQIRKSLVKKTVAQAISRWENAPAVVVFDGVDELTDTNLRSSLALPASGTDAAYKRSARKEPQGFFYRNTVFINSARMPDEKTVIETLMHEALGHYGLRGTFGSALDSVLEEVATLRKNDIERKMNAYRIKNTRRGRLIAAEEVLADIAQTVPDISLVQRATSDVRNWLRANIDGLQNMELTREDIITKYILPARAFVQRAGEPEDNAGNNAAIIDKADLVINRTQRDALIAKFELAQNRAQDICLKAGIANPFTPEQTLHESLIALHNVINNLQSNTTVESIQKDAIGMQLRSHFDEMGMDFYDLFGPDTIHTSDRHHSVEPVKDDTDFQWPARASGEPKFSDTAEAQGMNPEYLEQIDTVEKIYGGKETFARLKDREETNLTYGQWLMVRTPNFKKWFGDWEAFKILNGQSLMDLSTENSPSGTLTDIARWASKIFIALGGKAFRPEIGEILLDERAAKNSLSHGGANKYKKVAFLAVKEVIEKGALIYKGVDGRKESYYISAPVSIDMKANIETVLIHRDHNTKRMYLHSVKTKENLLQQRVSSVDAEASERSGSITTEGVSILIHEIINGKRFLSSLDENGEPLVLYHGSPTPENLTQFIPGGSDGSIKSGDAYGVASYFTSSPREASFYAKESGAVLPVFVRGNILDFDRQLTPDQSQKLTQLANQLLLPSEKARFPLGRSVREFANAEDGREFLESQRANWEAFGDNIDRTLPQIQEDNGKYRIEYTNFDAPVTIQTGADAFALFKAIGFDNIPAAGFDGAVMKRDGGHLWYIMHNADGNIKSTMGNNGDFNATNPDIRFRMDDEPREFLEGEQKPNVAYSRGNFYYSALTQAVEHINAKSLTPEHWLQQIAAFQKKGTVKAAEVEWSGLADWVSMQEGKITKEQILGYLDNNGVQVEEVVLGGPQMDYEQWLERTPNAMEMSDDERDEAYDTAAAAGGGATKYAKYQLPGGENYREVLLTLPEKETEWGVYNGSKLVSRHKSRSEARDSANAAELEYDSIRSTPYTSRHWDQPNILAHIRMNDRIDADGEKTLFIEELQSDWGQDGKKKGFIGEELTKLNAAMQEYDLLVQRMVNNPSRFSAEDRARIEELRPIVSGKGRVEAGVPVAPFVTTTDGWLNLALKRIIKMAVDEGYDKVAFINGEQSSERYDLSKQVDAVHLTKEPNDMVMLWADREERSSENGRAVMLNQSVPANKLADYIGKDLADRATRELADKDIGSSVEYSGLDLKVGGEGMKAFYDKIVPNTVNALLKKVGGGKVEEIEIGDTSRSAKSNSVFLNGSNVVDARTGNRLYTGGNESEAKQWALDNDYSLALARQSQAAFTITPAMREAASNGFPLFARNQDGKGVEEGGKPGMTEQAVTDLVQSITSKWRNAPEIVIVNSMDDPRVPYEPRMDERRQRKLGAKGTVKGFVYGGKAYIVAGNMRSNKDVVLALYHECLGHMGLRGVFGNKLNNVLMQVARNFPVAVRLKGRQYKLDLNTREGLLDSAEEVLADIAQTKPSLSILERATSAVKNVLRNHVPGFKNLRMTRNDLIAGFILPARNFVERKSTGFNIKKLTTSFLRAFHGTPHYGIEKFSTEKIGTGEGAQAYGWGLYFASRREVAEHYRKTLTANRYTFNGIAFEQLPSAHERSIVMQFARMVEGEGMLPHEAVASIQLEAKESLKRVQTNFQEVSDNLGKTVDVGAGWGDLRYYTYTHEALEKAKQSLESIRNLVSITESLQPDQIKKNTGQLYEVEIPEESEMLDWDRSLNEQPEFIRNALKMLPGMDARTTKMNAEDNAILEGLGLERPPTSDLPLMSGRDLYETLTKEWSASIRDRVRNGEFINDTYTEAQKMVSLSLASVGIKGIKYLDGATRNSSKDSHNYVIFDGNDVAIERTLFRRTEDEQIAATEINLNGKSAYTQARKDGKTKLDYSQWLQVRTPQFKAWFGDWENDPANASKAVDPETGEPMVYYHGSESSGFAAFDTKGKGKTKNTGAFFTDDYSMAKGYSSSNDDAPVYTANDIFNNPSLLEDIDLETGILVDVMMRDGRVTKEWFINESDALDNLVLEPDEKLEFVTGYRLTDSNGYETIGTKDEIIKAIDDWRFEMPGIYSVFLNVRDLVEINWNGNQWDQGPREKVWEVQDSDGDIIEYLYTKEDADQYPDHVIKETSQPIYETTDEAARAVKDMGADGALLRDVWDTGPHGDSDNGNVLVVYKPENIKSAISNNGYFNPNNPDIRYKLSDDTKHDSDARLRDVQAEIRALRQQIEADPISERAVESIHALKEIVEKDAQETLASGQAAVYVHNGDDTTYVLTPSAQNQGQFQLTRYVQFGAFGDSQYTSISKAIDENGLIHMDRLPFEKAEQRLNALMEAEAQHQLRTAAASQADVNPIENEEKNAAFKAWFGNSKVTDKNGKPLVVYHGTILHQGQGGIGDITAFDRLFTTQFRKHSIDTVGSWFSTNPGEGGAEMYSGTGSGSVIYPVHLSIQNPQVTTFALMTSRARKLANGKDDGRPIGKAEVDAYRNWLKSMGKDGIKIEGSGNEGSTEFDNQDAWIALEPTQVKSAVGNNGDFNPDNPDIRFKLDSSKTVANDFALPPAEREKAFATDAEKSESKRLPDGWIIKKEGRLYELLDANNVLQMIGYSRESLLKKFNGAGLFKEDLTHMESNTSGDRKLVGGAEDRDMPPFKNGTQSTRDSAGAGASVIEIDAPVAGTPLHPNGNHSWAQASDAQLAMYENLMAIQLAEANVHKRQHTALEKHPEAIQTDYVSTALSSIFKRATFEKLGTLHNNSMTESENLNRPRRIQKPK